ncbi:hypothetical protein [Actinocrispum sp. NPDC049592]|uniref:hypothetical protein n=1 Tax=Actinocrispum sp. NPDC049592 TaxID=3154835 RepID=UPI00343CA2FF
MTERGSTVERWLMQPDVPVRHYRDLGYEALAEVPDAVDDVAEDAAEVPPGQAAG